MNPKRCEFNQGLEFTVRTEGNTNVMSVRAGFAPAVPLGDVGRNRNGCAPQLIGEAESLIERKALRQTVAVLDQIHRLLPDIEVLIDAENRHANAGAQTVPPLDAGVLAG